MYTNKFLKYYVIYVSTLIKIFMHQKYGKQSNRFINIVIIIKVKHCLCLILYAWLSMRISFFIVHITVCWQVSWEIIKTPHSCHKWGIRQKPKTNGVLPAIGIKWIDCLDQTAISRERFQIINTVYFYISWILTQYCSGNMQN